MRLSIAAVAALTCAFAYAAIRKAGVAPGDWNACLVAIGVIVAIYGLVARPAQALRVDRVIGICLCAVLGIAVLQVIPLPVGMVRVLSPARFELYDAAARVTGEHAHALTLSAMPYESAQYLLTVCGYALIFLFIVYCRQQVRNQPWMLVWPLLSVGAMEAVLGCFQVLAGAIDGARGTYASHDHFAGLLETALPFALAYPFAALKRGRERRRFGIGASIGACLAIAIFILLLTGVILSTSRMGFLAALAAIFVVLASLAAIRNWSNGAARQQAWPKWIAVFAVSAIIVLGIIYLPTDALIARFAALPQNEGLSPNARMHIWRESLGLVKDYPLFGCGLGSYVSCFLRYKVAAPMYTVDYAHNDYLQVLAELGIFGFIAGLILVLRVLLGVIRGIRHGRASGERYIAIACLGSLTAILLHSFVDFNLYVPANGFEFAWVFGIAALYTNPRNQKRLGEPKHESPAIERELIANTA